MPSLVAFVTFSAEITISNNTVQCFSFVDESVTVIKNFPESLHNAQGKAVAHITCSVSGVLGPGVNLPHSDSVICLCNHAFLNELTWLI